MKEVLSCFQPELKASRFWYCEVPIVHHVSKYYYQASYLSGLDMLRHEIFQD